MAKEKIFSNTKLLVSKTDEKGLILFANDDFCEVAGYSIEELIHKPHNIIRHPDMPSWAFEELWETIKKGEPWSGFVKNKTKDNEYYWVFARVFRTYTSDNIIEYVSIRENISLEEKQHYEKYYKENQNEKKK